MRMFLSIQTLLPGDSEMTSASFLRGLEILPALETVVGAIPKASALITCWYVADPGAKEPDLKIDLVLRGVPILTDRSDRCRVGQAVEEFSFQLSGLERIYLICDRYAPGIEPPAGKSWDEDTRTKCVKTCLMMCLAMLFRSSEVRELLEANSTVLCLGMLQENDVTVLTDENERMIRFARQNIPKE